MQRYDIGVKYITWRVSLNAGSKAPALTEKEAKELEAWLGHSEPTNQDVIAKLKELAGLSTQQKRNVATVERLSAIAEDYLG